jgi:hypothetical protein
MADEDPCQKPKPRTAEKPLQSPGPVYWQRS